MNDKRIPAEVFPPGEHIKDELDARGWTVEEFAERIDSPVGLVERIISGEQLISIHNAKKIGDVFGTGEMIWLNLQVMYRKYGKGKK